MNLHKTKVFYTITKYMQYKIIDELNRSEIFVKDFIPVSSTAQRLIKSYSPILPEDLPHPETAPLPIK